jgi:5'-methylthioadenosine phosphorylase
LALRIGVIGGSGLYEMPGLENLREERVETPFGEPSAPYVIGTVSDVGEGDVELVFLPRHGKGHTLTPSEVPYRANVFGMKALGVSWLISASAVGSLRKEVAPGDVVLIDQFIDRTKGRDSTFFEDGIVAHVSFGDPICKALRGYLKESALRAGATVHDGGTYVCMEGPAFSTRAESNLYRSWGASVIGMTNLPEAKLAREAEMSYATLAMSTDYDCWYEGHDEVTVEQVIAVLRANVELSKAIIRGAIPFVAAHPGPAPHASALKNAIVTAPSAIPQHRIETLGPLVSKYLS